MGNDGELSLVGAGSRAHPRDVWTGIPLNQLAHPYVVCKMDLHRFPLGLLVIVASCAAEQPTGGDTDADTAEVDDGTETETDGEDADLEPLCGTQEEGWQAGERLRPRVVRPQDGVGRLVGWHDTMLDVDCDFEMATDGVWRCLPAGQEIRVYSDEDCQVPGAIESTLTESTAYLRKEGCAGTEIFETGELQGGFIFVFEDGECQQRGNPEHYAVGAPVPPSTWVAATVMTETGDTALQRRHLEAEEGTCAALQSSIAESGLPANARLTADGTLRFLPTGILASGRLWDSESCDGTEAVESCEAPSAILLEQPSESACDDRFRVHGIGTELTAGAFEARSSCEPRTVREPITNVYSVGAELPSDAFPVAVEGRTEGPGRLQHVTHTLEGGGIVDTSHEYWDTELDRSCRSGATSDGLTRCIPRHIDVVFVDSECQERRAFRRTELASLAAKPCGPPGWAAEWVPGTDGDAGYSDVFRVGMEDTSATDIYRLQGTDCAHLQTHDPQGPQGPLWLIDALESPETFVLLETVLE